MSRNIERRELLDVYEKEGIMNNRLKMREANINEFHIDFKFFLCSGRIYTASLLFVDF